MFWKKKSSGLKRSRQSSKLIDNEKEQEEQYIFYNQSKKIQATKIELEIRLNSNEKHKVKLLIDRKSSIQYLSFKIADFMENFKIYTNLEGLKAVNLSKKSDKCLISIPNNNFSEVREYFEDGNIIFCDLETEEYWVKLKMNLFDHSKEPSTSLEIKVKTKLTIREFKAILIKQALRFFSAHHSKIGNLHYLFVDANCTLKFSKKNISFKIENLSQTDEYDQNLVSEIFDFTSQLNVDFRLISIEELIFKNFIENSKFVKEKYIDLSNLRFFELIESDNFVEEYNTISRLTKKYIKTQISNQNLVLTPENFKSQINYSYNDIYYPLVIVPQNDKLGFRDDPLIGENELYKSEKKSIQMCPDENFTRKFSLDDFYDRIGHKSNRDLKTNSDGPEQINKFLNKLKSDKKNKKTNKSRNLCMEIIDLIKIKTIKKIIESSSKLRISGDFLEKSEIPQFRNYNPLERKSFNGKESVLQIKTSLINENFHRNTFIFLTSVFVLFFVAVLLILLIK